MSNDKKLRRYDGKSVFIYGLGRSGRALIRYLLEEGARITCFDDSSLSTLLRKDKTEFTALFEQVGISGSPQEGAGLEARRRQLTQPCQSADAEPLSLVSPDSRVSFFFRDPPIQEATDADLFLLSPGVPLDKPLVLSVRKAGVPLKGELGFAIEETGARVIAVTGTNGKSTISSFIYQLLGTSREDLKGEIPRKLWLLGNIGEPVVNRAKDIEQDDLLVLEVSSYQLETMELFSPEVAVISNITPDHLERHKGFQEYARVKRSIAENMKEGSTLILNGNDPELAQKRFSRTKAELLYFYSSNPGDLPLDGAFIERSAEPSRTDQDGKIVAHLQGRRFECNLKDIPLLGEHNYENVMAALLTGLCYGIPDEKISRWISNLKPLPHRLEEIRVNYPIKVYNDSKGTNPVSTILALRAVRPPILLILGGQDKGTDLTELAREVKDRVKLVLLIGEALARFRSALQDVGYSAITDCLTLDRALDIAKRELAPGDTLLLSPACASFDQFRDFEERGDIFREIVLGLFGRPAIDNPGSGAYQKPKVEIG